jgi:hypothetical protein
MNTTFIKTIRTLSVAASVAISLTSFAAHAVEATAEQRRACTPDAFRLCSSHIPNIEAITACMRANKSKLSPECKVVFDKSDKTTVASRKDGQAAQ